MKTFPNVDYIHIDRMKSFGLTTRQVDDILTYLHDEVMLISSLGYDPEQGCERCRDWEDEDDAYNQGWDDAVDAMERAVPSKSRYR